MALCLDDCVGMTLKSARGAPLCLELVLDADELSLHACLEVLKLQVDAGDGLLVEAVGLRAVDDNLDVRQLLLDVREALGDVALESGLDVFEMIEVRVQVRAELVATGLQSHNFLIKGVKADLHGLVRDEVLDVTGNANVMQRG